jgi:membrane-associated phospholipid phosphatase
MEWVEAVRSVYLTTFFHALTNLGASAFLLLFLVFGFLAINKVVFARAIAIVLVSAIINDWLKNYFHDPRPPQALWLDSSIADTFGFPSGHAQVAVALWLWLAYHVRQRWGALLLVALTVGIALSRLYLGVHDVEDVLGGAAIGFVILAVFIVWSAERLSEVRERYSVLPLAAAMTLTLICLTTWPGVEMRNPLLLGGFLCAFWFGYRIEGRRVRFQTTDRTRSGLAGVVGVVGMLVLLGVLAFLRDGSSLQLVPAAFLVGLYVSVFAPILMVRMGLLEKSSL